MKHYTLDDVLKSLEGAIEHAGSASAYAAKLGVSRAFVSAVRTSKSLPSGVILSDLGYEPVTLFRFIGSKPSPEQERYENSRREHRERFPNISKEELAARDPKTETR